MRLLVLDENYPHLDNLMGDVFVHVRVKEYIKRHEVAVFSYFHNCRNLQYEGVSIQMFDNIDTLVEAIRAYRPDKILIHFYQSWMLERVIKVLKVPVVIWVHGYEALGWYRRMFNYTLYSSVFFNHIKRNTKQQYHFRLLIRYANQTSAVHFVFVSNWMRRITECDTLTTIKAYNIIANPIDVNLFSYVPKTASLRNKILLLRSFGSKKYANDISVKAILALSKRKCFDQLSFTIIGNGNLFEKTLSPLRQLSNVTISKGPIRHSLIPGIHAGHGVFLCPTRQDAQGVSMCEAMSSGLVPVTSDNTAIPEFVSNGKTGILTQSAEEIADALENIFNNPDFFSQLSQAAAGSIRERCSIENIIEKELKIIDA